MVRITNAVASRRRTKKILKLCKGFYGDRKNHLKLSKDALMTALANNYKHRKLRKRDFRRLWTIRIGVGAKINGISYSKLIHGMSLAGIDINRKMLAEMAVRDAEGFARLVEQVRPHVGGEAAESAPAATAPAAAAPKKAAPAKAEPVVAAPGEAPEAEEPSA